MEYLQLDIISTNKWLQILSLSNQALHPTGVSFEHVSVRNVPKPTPLYPRKLSPRSTDGAISCKDLGCSICWWCYNFCDNSYWHTKATRGDTLFWSCIGGKSKHLKIESNSPWDMGQIHWNYEHPVPRHCNNLRLQIKNTVEESAFASWTKTTAKITGASWRSLLSNADFGQEDTICPWIPYGACVVCVPNLPPNLTYVCVNWIRRPPGLYGRVRYFVCLCQPYIGQKKKKAGSWRTCL